MPLVLPGVYVHATAVNDLLRGEGLRVLPRWAGALLILVLVMAISVAALDVRLWRGLAVALGGLVVWAALATGLFRIELTLPLLDGVIGGAVAFAAMVGFQLTVTDRKRRQLRRAFALYLSGAVIDRMLASEKLPQLGGEERELTVLFSDVAGFTSISESLTPEGLVTLMNTYLAAMTEIIEAEGGFVDKYIGDAIVAIFGAPQDDADHALSAVRAALACRKCLAGMQHEFAVDQPVDARIGLNTGRMLVGNIGSKKRFNYTVMGDAVNLAARLESVNKRYASSRLVSESTMSACGEGILFREVDCVRVKGRGAPTKLYEPLGMVDDVSDDTRAKAEAYGLALGAYQAGRFQEAVAAFEALAPLDVTAAAMARFAAETAASPPTDWQGVTTLDSK